MKIAKDGQLVKEVAAACNVQADQIEALVIFAQLPNGIMVAHTLHCNDCMEMAVAGTLGGPRIDMTNGAN